MRPSWTYKLGEDISIAKEEKDLGVVIQDSLSSEKHINRIFGDTFRMLGNIQMAFHFLDKDINKDKVGAHAIAAHSCGRSSPVVLVFQPVVEINPLCWDTEPL